jgi:CubicO group peptidase (beta-lactamase class C family)
MALITIRLIIFLLVPLWSLSQTVEERISKVGNNLRSWVRLDSNRSFNLFTRMQETGVNGLTIAVIDNYKIDWVRSYGMADTAEKLPVNNSTLFQSASIGKSIHGMAIVKLAAAGKLDLNRDINRYLRRYRYAGPTISLEQVLSHTAGLSVHGFDGYKTGDTIPTLLQVIAGKPPANNPPVVSQHAPATRFQYSGGGYELSELLLEDLTGRSYADFISMNIFRPLNMYTATYRLQPVNTATAYRYDRAAIGLPAGQIKYCPPNGRNGC